MPSRHASGQRRSLVRALRDTQALLASARDEQTACRVVAEQLVEVLDLDAVVVCVPTDEAGLRVSCATQLRARQHDDEQREAIDVCRESWRQGQSITRANEDSLNPLNVSGVPVQVLDRVVAVIGICWSARLKAPSQVLSRVNLIASPLGSALELLRLSSELANSARLAAAMSEFLCRDVRASLCEADVLELALRLAIRVLQPDAAAVWLLQPEQSLRCGAALGYPLAADGQMIPFNERLTRQATVGPVNQADVPIGAVAQLARGSYMGVPIRRHGTSLGALEVVGNAGRRYTATEEALLSALASGMAIGVTTAREASELEQEERRLGAVLEQMPSGVLVLDRAGRPVLMNSACRRIFGQRFDLDRPIAEQTADLELHAVRTEEHLPAGALLSRVLGGEAVSAYEATFRPAGSAIEHWLQASAVPLRDASARIVGAVVVVTDITHERQLAGDLAATVRQNLYLHGALAESERRLEDLIDNLLRPQLGARAPNAEQLDALTRREREVLGLLGKGKSTHEMARELQLSAGTVRLHVKHVLAKLGVSSRTQAALRAQELARRMS